MHDLALVCSALLCFVLLVGSACVDSWPHDAPARWIIRLILSFGATTVSYYAGAAGL